MIYQKKKKQLLSDLVNFVFSFFFFFMYINLFSFFIFYFDFGMFLILSRVAFLWAENIGGECRAESRFSDSSIEVKVGNAL